MVTFFNAEEVLEIVKEGSHIEKIITKKKEISAEKYILATGGKSYPQTGSSGQGFTWAKKLGHKIIEPKASLVPIKTKDDWAGELQGVSASSVSITLFLNGKKKFSDFGDLMFAHYGLSGPLALNISRNIAQLITEGEVKMVIDLKPYLSFEQLDEIVRKDLERKGSLEIKSCLGDIFFSEAFGFFA